MAVETAISVAVAMTRPISTGRARYRAAKVTVRSWLLSPSSATNTTPRATRNASTTQEAFTSGA